MSRLMPLGAGPSFPIWSKYGVLERGEKAKKPVSVGWDEGGWTLSVWQAKVGIRPGVGDKVLTLAFGKAIPRI